jgi:curved DNA-binding protein CbpA
MSQDEITGQTYCGRVSNLMSIGQSVECILGQGRSVLLSQLVGVLIFRGDTIEFALPNGGSAIGTEILVRKGLNCKRKDIYQARIGYVTKPKEDRRGQFYSLAEVRNSSIGISAIRLNCDIIRDYFYRVPFPRRAKGQPYFYEVLKTTPTASLAELRLAYKICDLELKTGHAGQRDLAAIERAFNILAEPKLRASYDALLKDPETPVLFPYGGFGALLAEGERSRDGMTFFARSIISFSPDRGEQSFKAPFRNFHFYADRAVYRDTRRRLELVVDQAAMPIVWDPTWNQWKHLLDSKADIQATFLQTGAYRMRDGEWNLVSWEKSLPSRIRVTLPADINERIEAARRRHHVFGQHADFFARLRARIEREPVAKSEIERLCGDAGIPGDFDVAQITWEADCDAFYYQELLKRARTVYFFRDEFIFELERVIATERPELGHATYLFAKPANMDGFLRLYAKTTKQAIRANRDNIAEHIGFVGRISHGVKPETWFETLRVFLEGSV